MRRFPIAIALACAACGGSTSGSGLADGGGATGGSGGVVSVGGGGSGGSGAFGGSGGALGGSGGVSTGGVGGCPPIAPAQQLGQFRLAIAATLAPTKPILYAMDVSTQDAFGGDALVRLFGQPLDSHDRVTPVGPPIELLSLPTDGTSLHFQPTSVEIPGAANPITGSDITATVALDGDLCGLSTFYCGDVSGNITQPIALDLTGSHFVLETVSTPEIHVDCNMTVADPPSP